MKNSEYNPQSQDSNDVNSLARDADEGRERIEKTLNLLGSRLSPEHLKEQAFDLFREHGGDIAAGLQRSARNNPVPLLLTGVGIAWMMMSQRDDRQRNEHYRQYPEFRQPPMDTRYIQERRAFSDRDSSSSASGEGLSEKFNDARDSLVDEASHTADEWANDASRFMRKQPLVKRL